MTVITVISNNARTTLRSYNVNGIPAGGVTGQSLVKVSNTNYDVEWDTALGSGDMLRSVYDPNLDGKIAYSSLSGLPTLAANTIVVNNLADFPIQDATTITLSDNTCYVLGSLISTSKRFIVGSGVTLTSFTNFAQTLEYTGSGVMFTNSGGNFAIFDIRYSCPNGTVFSYTGAGILLLERTACLSCVNVGAITSSGTTSLNWINNSFPVITGQGLQFFGTFFVMSFTKIFMSGTSASFIGVDLGSSSFYNIEVANIELFGISGSIGIKGLANSGNIQVGSVATVDHANFAGNLMTPLSGITPSDIRWHFEGNAKVEDTMDDAIIYFSGNTTNTVIVASSTNGSNAVKVAGTWQIGRTSKFAATSAGRITYLGEGTTTAPVDVSVHLIAVSGASIRVKVYIYKNGVIQPAASSAADISGSTSKNLTIPWQITFNQNDYIEVFVENQNNGNDILVEDAILRIR